MFMPVTIPLTIINAITQGIVQQEQEHKVISKLHEILRPFVLRRIKSIVLKVLMLD
jgi:SNF2 family DNA or RNA helicase